MLRLGERSRFGVVRSRLVGNIISFQPLKGNQGALGQAGLSLWCGGGRVELLEGDGGSRGCGGKTHTAEVVLLLARYRGLRL